MVVHRKHGIRLPSYEHYDLSGSLQKALKSLENIGHGTRMAIRCQKYLRKLIQIAAASGMLQQDFTTAGKEHRLF